MGEKTQRDGPMRKDPHPRLVAKDGKERRTRWNLFQACESGANDEKGVNYFLFFRQGLKGGDGKVGSPPGGALYHEQHPGKVCQLSDVCLCTVTS